MKKFILIVLGFILIASIYYNIGYQQGQLDTIKKFHNMVISNKSIIERVGK